VKVNRKVYHPDTQNKHFNFQFYFQIVISQPGDTRTLVRRSWTKHLHLNTAGTGFGEHVRYFPLNEPYTVMYFLLSWPDPFSLGCYRQVVSAWCRHKQANAPGGFMVSRPFANW